MLIWPLYPSRWCRWRSVCGSQPADSASRRGDTSRNRDACRKLSGQGSFWLLIVGFFVCGFHVTFIGLHMPAYISDKAVGMTLFGNPLSPLELGGWAIGLVGLFNIAGTLLWGWLGGKYLEEGHAGAAVCLARAGVPRFS